MKEVQSGVVAVGDPANEEDRMRFLSATNIFLCLGVVALAGCAAPPIDEPTGEQGHALSGPVASDSACIHSSFARVGNHVQGWVVDLCTGSPRPGAAGLTNGTMGKRDVFYANCEYWEGS